MMTDHEMETRLRDTLEVIAETTLVEDRPSVRLEHTAPVSSSRWIARPAVSLAFGFLLVLVSVGVVLVVAGRGGEPQTAATTTPVDRFPVFGVLPDGVEVSAEVSVSPQEPRYVKLVLGERTATGFTNAVNVLVWEEPVTITIPSNETIMVGDIEVMISPSDLAERAKNGVTIFWWVNGALAQAHDPDGRTDLAVAAMEALTIDATDGLEAESIQLGELPGQMEVLAEPELGTHQRSGSVTVQFGDGQLVATISRSTSALGAAVLGGNAEAIEIRGRPGYLIQVADWEILTWQETPTVAAKLSATTGVFTLEQLLSYADDLTYVNEETWATIYETANLSSDLTPTTTTPPAYTIDADGWGIVGAFADSSQPPIRSVTIHNTAERPTAELEDTPSFVVGTGGPIEAQMRLIESGATVPDGSFPLLGGEAFTLADYPGAGYILWASPTGTTVSIEYNSIDRQDAIELLDTLLPITEREWANLVDKNRGGPEVPDFESDPTR